MTSLSTLTNGFEFHSRAQAELNLAVYYSYEQEKVMMIDTVSASLSFMQFDDNHEIETGYRLPSDPY